MASDLDGSSFSKSRMDDEHVIYQYSYLRLVNGEVLVTDSRLVLGKESWPIQNVQDAEVVPRQMVVSSGNLNNAILTSYFIGVVLAGSALLLITLSPQGGMQILFFGGALLLFVLSGIIMVRTVAKNPGTVYKLKLTFIGSEDGASQHEAAYIWLDKWHAEKAVRAIHQALLSSGD